MLRILGSKASSNGVLHRRELLRTGALGLVSAGGNKGAYGFHMAGSTVAKDDRFDKRGPPEIVDMVQRGSSSDQALDDLVVAKVSGGYERRSLIGARDIARLRPKREREFHELKIVVDGCDRDNIIRLIVERIEICPCFCQRA